MAPSPHRKGAMTKPDLILFHLDSFEVTNEHSCDIWIAVMILHSNLPGIASLRNNPACISSTSSKNRIEVTIKQPNFRGGKSARHHLVNVRVVAVFGW